MAKDKINWEPNIKKSFEIQNNIKDINQKLKDDADKRKIDGFNPGDLFVPKDKSWGK